MKILQMMKSDLADIRGKMAAGYRSLRKENPAKARMLFRRMSRATQLTEQHLQDNLQLSSEPRFTNDKDLSAVLA